MDPQRHDREAGCHAHRNHRRIHRLHSDVDSRRRCRRTAFRRSGADRGQHWNRAQKAWREFRGGDRSRRSELRQGRSYRLWRRDHRFRAEAHDQGRRHRERTHPHTRQHRGEGNSSCAGAFERARNRRPRSADRQEHRPPGAAPGARAGRGHNSACPRDRFDSSPCGRARFITRRSPRRDHPGDPPAPGSPISTRQSHRRCAALGGEGRCCDHEQRGNPHRAPCG